MIGGVSSGRIAIIGLGLIGASLARALRAAERERARGLSLVGCDQDSNVLQRARELGLVDETIDDIGAAVQGVDLVCLAVPLRETAGVLERLVPRLADSTLVTDVGSVKGTVVEDARAILGPRMPQFVPGHPIAGTEKSGIEASFAELFKDQWVILTPVAETDPEAVGAVADLWRQVGARVVVMEVVRHDQVLAATSHLPHALAYTLVQMLAQAPRSDGLLRYAAGGLADLTRIASSSPTLWRDIFLANRTHLLEVIERFELELATLRAAISERDQQQVLTILERAKAARDALAAERGPRATEIHSTLGG